MTSSIGEEGVLRKLLQQMNSQAPLKRRKLSELIEMKEPFYEARDGRRYDLAAEELTLIKSTLRDLGMDDIKLPIVIMADSGHEQSSWKVEGEPECALVSRLIGKAVGTRTDELFLYAPHLAVLRRKLPTVTVCIFLP